MSKNLKLIFLIILFCISLGFLGGSFLHLKNNQVYSLKHNINDRFYSYDDIYYASRVFCEDNNEKYILTSTSVKHPLLLYNAHHYMKTVNYLTPNSTIDDNFVKVEVLQLIFSMIGIIYFYLILANIIKLKPLFSFLLSLIFLFSNATIISSLLVESFIFSSTLLIMSYYYISKKNAPISGLLGVLVFGTTITNVFIWGIMLLLINIKDIKYLIKSALYFVLFFIIILSIIWVTDSKYLELINENFFNTIIANKENFGSSMTFKQSIKYTFYFLGASGLYYIDTVNTNQLGRDLGNAISFIPSAKTLITLVVMTIYLTVAILSIKIIKSFDKNIFTCYGIILFNLFLHFFVKFGLTEAFLYTPHFLFAIIILLGVIIKKHENKSIIIITSLIIIIGLQFVYNFQSIGDILRLVGQK